VNVFPSYFFNKLKIEICGITIFSKESLNNGALGRSSVRKLNIK